MHALFDELQFRVLRERLFKAVAAAEPEAEEGFDVSLRPARRRRGRAVARRARPRRRPGRRGLPRAVGPRHRLAAPASRSPARTAPRPISTRAAQPRRRRGAGRVARRPVRARRPPTTSRARCWRCASTAGRIAGVTSDTQLGGLPAASGPAHLRPRRPRAALPAPRAAQQRRGVRAAHP